jgi:catechol 2,3-dioxygenase-like lactoylglutathione lyase family enzyme
MTAGVKALWLPCIVGDLRAARDFYTVRLGLSEVDSWSDDLERGSVLRAAAGAFVELVEPGGGARQHSPPPLAFEVDDDSAVDGYAARLGAERPPRRYPRGHYGFEMSGPAGATIMVWSERA